LGLRGRHAEEALCLPDLGLERQRGAVGKLFEGALQRLGIWPLDVGAAQA
jgi:hypothetical protein